MMSAPPSRRRRRVSPPTTSQRSIRPYLTPSTPSPSTPPLPATHPPLTSEGVAGSDDLVGSKRKNPPPLLQKTVKTYEQPAKKQ
jgi:hypothetical protein